MSFISFFVNNNFFWSSNEVSLLLQPLNSSTLKGRLVAFWIFVLSILYLLFFFKTPIKKISLIFLITLITISPYLIRNFIIFENKVFKFHWAKVTRDSSWSNSFNFLVFCQSKKNRTVCFVSIKNRLYWFLPTFWEIVKGPYLWPLQFWNSNEGLECITITTWIS